MSKKWNLGTLEQDFRDIGLIHESREETQQTQENNDSTDPEIASLIERTRIIKKRRGAKVKLMARKARRWYKKMKGRVLRLARKYRKTARAKKLMKRHATKLAVMGGPKKGRIIRTAGIDRVSNLIEDVERILSGIGARQEKEVIKGFANLALIADTLSKNFSAMGEGIEEKELKDLGEAYEEMAEAAAEMAEKLDKGEMKSSDEVVQAFKEDMNDLLDGIDLFSDLIEGDDDDDDDDDDDEVTEQEDETCPECGKSIDDCECEEQEEGCKKGKAKK